MNEEVIKLNNRFWSKVNKTDDCWVWTGGGRGRGYGSFKYQGIVYDSHRFSLFLVTGHWPEQWVLHRCNNRRCVRPTHLYEGTPKENTRDAIRIGSQNNNKGRVFTKHGTITMYNWHKCRCTLCRKAKSTALKRQRLD